MAESVSQLPARGFRTAFLQGRWVPMPHQKRFAPPRGANKAVVPFQFLASKVALVTYALSQVPMATTPPNATTGNGSRSLSTPMDARPNRTIPAITPPEMRQPGTIFSRGVMWRVPLNSLAFADWLVRRVSALNSFCVMRLLCGVTRVAGTGLENRALNSWSVCNPLRWLHGRHITCRLPTSLDPPRTAGIMWSISRVWAGRR